MRHPRLRPWLLSVAALSVFAIALGTSCAQQQEGERCDRNNGISGGDSDCNDGLQCTEAKVLGTDTDRCCPADRSQATVAPCTISSNSLNQDASPPATTTDSSVDGTTTTDSSTTDGSSTDSGDSGVADAAEGG